MRQSASPKNQIRPQLKVMDALIREGGLARNPRSRGAVRRTERNLERNTARELAGKAPVASVAANGTEWLAVPEWQPLDWLWHGFSTRRGGVSRAYCADDAQGELNLGFTADDSKDAVIQNRRLFAEAVTGDSATPLITVKQIHSNLVVRVGKADVGRAQPAKADGLMTNEPGILLSVLTADCIPVLVADSKRKAVAAFHAGWRGTVKRIVETGVGRMRLEFGSQPEDLVAAIGPGVGACCYAVGEEVLSAFESQFSYARELFHEVYEEDPVRLRYPMLFMTQRAPGHSSVGYATHLDLVEANRRQLLAAGVKPTAIQAVGGCTNCQPELFFSHRGSHGRAGRMMAAIGIRGRAKALRPRRSAGSKR